jgi:carbon-monoxide dehydrogenase medium subunit
VRSRYPILVDTASVIADPLVRNLATVAGNLAHGDPANDHPATMLALGAEVVATGPKGARTIPIAQFFTGLFTTALAPNEVLTEIRIPAPPPGSGGAYVKLERKVGDFATAGAAAFLVVKGGVIERAGIGLTNVGPTPIKATEAEKFLAGKKPDEATFAEAGRLAAAATSRGGPPRLRGIQEGHGARAHRARAAQGGPARRREVAMAKHKRPRHRERSGREGRT